jgi:2-dehydro-3-deoxyphosphogluconate aldolase/(4S)-4-hydroxy-2-oxoglutarate aldolase
MGSKLFPKDQVAAGNWKYISDKCAEAIGYFKK